MYNVLATVKIIYSLILHT